jgi:hypothetical protein
MKLTVRWKLRRTAAGRPQRRVCRRVAWRSSAGCRGRPPEPARRQRVEREFLLLVKFLARLCGSTSSVTIQRRDTLSMMKLSMSQHDSGPREAGRIRRRGAAIACQVQVGAHLVEFPVAGCLQYVGVLSHGVV